MVVYGSMKGMPAHALLCARYACTSAIIIICWIHVNAVRPVCTPTLSVQLLLFSLNRTCTWWMNLMAW